jgi:hypothetical protein
MAAHACVGLISLGIVLGSLFGSGLRVAIAGIERIS